MKKLDSFVLLYNTLLNDIRHLIENYEYTEKDIESITRKLDRIFNMVTKTLDIKNIYDKIDILRTLYETDRYFTSGETLGIDSMLHTYNNLINHLDRYLKDTHYSIYIKYNNCPRDSYIVEEVIIVNNETHTLI
jgi:hypothetical protein